MGLEDKMHKAFEKAHKAFAVKQTVIGTAVNVRDTLCDLEIEEGAKLFDVRLQVVFDAVDNKFLIRPKEGTKVIAAALENLEHETCIIQCSEVENVWIESYGKRIKIESAGILIEADKTGGTDTLKEALDKIIDAVVQITVLQGTNPDYVKLQEAKTAIANILQ